MKIIINIVIFSFKYLIPAYLILFLLTVAILKLMV